MRLRFLDSYNYLFAADIPGLAVGVAGASAVGDGADAALPGWGLGSNNHEVFYEGTWCAGSDF
jgi:hypothetical protein